MLLFRTQLLEFVIFELPRPHATLKHNVQLLIRPALGFWHPKIAPHEAQRGEAAKEKAKFAAQVGLIWIDHVWNRNSHHDADQSLHGRREGDRLPADSSGRAFAQDDEADGSDGLSVCHLSI